MISVKIRVIRESSKINQKDFAKMFDISYTTLQNYEYDKTSPDFIFIDKLLKHFNLDICHFLNSAEGDIKATSNSGYYVVQKLNTKPNADIATNAPLEAYKTGQTLRHRQKVF